MNARRQPITAILLAFSLAAHAGAIIAQSNRLLSEPYPGFKAVFALFIILSAFGSLIFFVSTRRIIVRLCLIARLICLAAAGYPLGNRFDTMLVLFLPLALEVAFYEKPAASRFLLSALTVLACGFQAFTLARSAAPVPIIIQNTAVILAQAGIAAATAVLLSHYRSMLVRYSADNARLDRAVHELSELNINYQALALSAGETSAKNERQRMTRELHDALGYALTNIAVMMEAGGVKIDSEPARTKEILSMARRQAVEGLAEVREALYALRDHEEKAPRGLNAISRLIAIFRVASQVQVKVDFCNAPSAWEEPVERAMFHFVREALTNAVKHGAADRIEIVFQYHDATLEAVVLDNGTKPAVIKEGLGIQGMRERLGPIGGTLSYRNTAAGFEIRAAVPLKD